MTPIEEKYRLNGLAQGLDKFFNGKDKGKDRKVGFVLLFFPFGQREGRGGCVSNGIDGRAIVTALKNEIKRLEGRPDAEEEG